jgi:hypothetical protein
MWLETRGGLGRGALTQTSAPGLHAALCAFAPLIFWWELFGWMMQLTKGCVKLYLGNLMWCNILIECSCLPVDLKPHRILSASLQSQSCRSRALNYDNSVLWNMSWNLTWHCSQCSVTLASKGVWYGITSIVIVNLSSLVSYSLLMPILEWILCVFSWW